MSQTITIRDEEAAGNTLREFSLDFLTEHITVRELIRSRVHQEVKDYNAQQNQTEFNGLVQPTDSERTLNGYKMKQPRQIDWHEQFDRAVEAFERNQILILVDDRQAESLDETIEIRTDTAVTFLRLTLLVGGCHGKRSLIRSHCLSVSCVLAPSWTPCLCRRTDGHNTNVNLIIRVSFHPNHRARLMPKCSVR